ncbi:hypothetical protein [Thermococcus sp.]|uniref:hypothetical protein n=1 Tax=Thermococcus sp. TaxID=35749 RepID=UPI0026061F34|nr:hypothetical protein [Thermococcus sp.]
MGSYYDTIPNFRYWDVEAWKNYIKEYIVPIYKSTTALLELRNELLPYVGKSLKAVKDNDERLLPFFVGGIDENGNYKERSLAKLIKLMFGIYVEPREFSIAVGEVGEKGLKAVRIKSKDEKEISFLRMIKGLNEASSTILRKAKIETQHNIGVNEILQDPNKLLDILKDLYKACVSFSANHNYYTFFVISTAGLHWKYIIAAYPKLKENFEELKDFLGLEPIFVPDVESEEIKKNYTIWGHKVDGIANNLYQMQIRLWLFFDVSQDRIWMLNHADIYPSQIKEVLAYAVPEVENLRQDYISFVEKLLPQYTISKISGLKRLDEYGVEYYLRINGVFILEYWNKYSPSYYKHIHEQAKCSFPEFLDTVGPRLFLGLSRIISAKEPDVLIYDDNFVKEVERWL